MRQEMSQQTGKDGSTPLPQETAFSAGLRYVTDGEKGLRRVAQGKGFRFLRADGSTVADVATLERIRSLVIPPAWTDVWICPSPNGHLQAHGRDAKGRKQYKYHPEFRASRESTKFEHLLEFAAALPKIRERIDADMSARGLPREKVLATIVHLLERTLIRVGNSDYSKTNKSYGLTTLLDRHVEIDRGEMRFQFTGKSGKSWSLKLSDRRIARVVKACQDIPGQHLFQYIDEGGERQAVSSGDVNDYLREIAGADVSTKNFRTWAGTVLAAVALIEYQRPSNATHGKKCVKEAIARVAALLGNTPTVCRKCYVHPLVVETFLEGTLPEQLRLNRRNGAGLSPEEKGVLKFLASRLKENGTRH
jgi:DNA topoisomerase I